jgi:Tfp pilus assembly protein PilX
MMTFNPLRKILKQRLCSRLSEENGMALTIAMVLLAMLAFLGAAALMTSSTEMDIAGNERAYQQTFYAADGGTQLAVRVIKDLVSSHDDPGYGTPVTVDVDCLRAELKNIAAVTDGEGNPCNDDTDTQATNPDIECALTADLDMDVDVDRSGAPELLPGSGVEFGAGHEGLGTGTAKGGARQYYEEFSESQGPRNATSLVQHRYRHVIGMTGGS